MDLVLTNRVLTAEEAEQWGLVNRVVPDDELQSVADELVAQLAAGPTGAFGTAKRLLVEGATLDLATAMAHETEGIAGICRTPDAIEAVAAFVEKREPAFRPALTRPGAPTARRSADPIPDRGRRPS